MQEPVRAGGRGVAAVLVVLLVAAGGLAAWQWAVARGLADEESRRDAVAAAAADMGVALLSYDHADLDGSADAVLALASPTFAAQYRDAFDGGLSDSIAELEASAEGRVTSTYVVTPLTEPARAIVVVDAEVTTTVGTRMLDQAYLEMDLVEVDGTWKVDGVTSVSALAETLVPTGDPDDDAAAP